MLIAKLIEMGRFAIANLREGRVADHDGVNVMKQVTRLFLFLEPGGRERK